MREGDYEALLRRYQELERRYDGVLNAIAMRTAMEPPAPMVFCSDCPKAQAVIHQFSFPGPFVPAPLEPPLTPPQGFDNDG